MSLASRTDSQKILFVRFEFILLSALAIRGFLGAAIRYVNWFSGSDKVCSFCTGSLLKMAGNTEAHECLDCGRVFQRSCV